MRPAADRVQQQARALGDPTRHAIFRFIAASPGPVGIADINERFALNHNAIRQHVAKLTGAGLVVGRRAAPAGPGRPRHLYEVDPAARGRWEQAGPHEQVGPYEQLSRLLAEVTRTGLGPEEVGRRAADGFRAPNPTGDPVTDLGRAMAQQGFEPEVRRTGDGAEVVLHRCPFASAAVVDPVTVCGLHLGIAQGLSGEAASVDELDAADPAAAGCRLRVRTRR